MNFVKAMVEKPSPLWTFRPWHLTRTLLLLLLQLHPQVRQQPHRVPPLVLALVLLLLPVAVEGQLEAVLPRQSEGAELVVAYFKVKVVAEDRVRLVQPASRPLVLPYRQEGQLSEGLA